MFLLSLAFLTGSGAELIVAGATLVLAPAQFLKAAAGLRRGSRPQFSNRYVILVLGSISLIAVATTLGAGAFSNRQDPVFGVIVGLATTLSGKLEYDWACAPREAGHRRFK